MRIATHEISLHLRSFSRTGEAAAVGNLPLPQLSGKRLFNEVHMLPLLCIFLFAAVFSEATAVANKKRVLVFGGTGFVGGNFVKAATASGKYSIVSASRRGLPADGHPASSEVEWVKVDAADAQQVKDLFAKLGPFDACVHTVGLLFDQSSGLSSFNAYASGSGSVPDSDATYDRVIRITATNAISSFAAQKPAQNPRPFIFISAAEAGWPFKAPVSWLERYLIAKRAVEEELLSTDASIVRPVIFRPSLVWTKQRPQALPSVIPFYIASRIGIPFIDRPVTVDTLVDAMLTAIDDGTVEGVKRYHEMDALAAQKQSQQ